MNRNRFANSQVHHSEFKIRDNIYILVNLKMVVDALFFLVSGAGKIYIWIISWNPFLVSFQGLLPTPGSELYIFTCKRHLFHSQTPRISTNQQNKKSIQLWVDDCCGFFSGVSASCARKASCFCCNRTGLRPEVLLETRECVGTTPHPVTVTTRIIPFLVGESL